MIDDTRDWTAIVGVLHQAASGDETDDYIDALCDEVLSAPDPRAAQALAYAVDKASSTLTVRSAALALSVCATANDTLATDTLVSAYKRHQIDIFLGPAMLDALSISAYVNVVARYELASLILRLKPDGQRYLLIKACQVIGRLDSLQSGQGLHVKLEEFAGADDAQVQAEARQQIAVIRLCEALGATDRDDLFERLALARMAFARAEASEELRPDAHILGRLVDIMTGFRHTPNVGPEQLERIGTSVSQVKALLPGSDGYNGFGYGSPSQDLIYIRTLAVAETLFRAAEAVATMDDWTNFDSALVGLATLLTLSRPVINGHGVDNRLHDALTAVPSVIIPQLGPALLRSVGRRRLSRVREQYVLQQGHDRIAETLGALEAATAQSEYVPERSMADFPLIAEIATQMNESPESFIRRLMTALERHPGDSWVYELGLGALPLPIDRPTFYGGDHNVDEVVRPLLQAARKQLGNYPRAKWDKFVAVLERVVQLAQYLRDVPPPFMLCEESGGLGSAASERDLQERIFETLRHDHGQGAVYELQRVGGGRPDTGVQFSDCRLPIEVKHEFRSIARDHIREKYVIQTDVYASCTDRIALLMILDLRPSNASGHVKRRRNKAATAGEPVISSLYSLADSFWVEQLLPDPQVSTAQQNLVIVGIFPGNRFRPSHATSYSQRPRSS